MEDSAEESKLKNAISEKEIYDGILANLDGLDETDATAMYSIKEEFPSFERNYTYEEIKDPKLRSVINDHNYISSEDSYSRDVRQNLIDFVQLTNSSLLTNYASTSESQVETLIDSVLTFLSKVTDYDLTIDKIKTVFNLDGQEYPQIECAEDHNLSKDEILLGEVSVDEAPTGDDFPQELHPDIKLELSAFIKMEGDDAPCDIELPSIEEDQLMDEQKAADDEMSELDKQIEMILGKEDEEEEMVEKNLLELEKEASIVEAKNLVISKVEYTYDPNFEKKKDEDEQKQPVPDAECNDIPVKIIETPQSTDTATEIEQTTIQKQLDDTEPMPAEASDSTEPKELDELPDGSSSSSTNTNNDEETEKTSELAENESPKTNESIDFITKQPEVPPPVKELLKFAEQLKEDCLNFCEKADFSIEDFLALKFREHRSSIQSVLFKDSTMQTEKIISKKKLRKMNASDKRHLLESSNDSDSSNSSYMDKTLNELEVEYKNSKKKYFSGSQRSSKESLTSKKTITKDSKYFRSDSDESNVGISPFHQSLASLSRHESDDLGQMTDIDEIGKDKTTKLERSPSQEDFSLSSSSSSSEKSNAKTEDKNMEKRTNESDKENRDSITSSESCESKKSKQDDGIEDDAQEKEIERLLNLKGLVEPQKNAPSVNQTRQKASNKAKADNLFDVMQEIDRNSLSDDSIGEDSEQILTEKQFLVKCNENLKKQLLDSASSDSENSTNNEDIELINKINDNSSDEENHRVSYVDKFLETLVDDEGKSSIHEDDASKKEDSPSRIDTPKSSIDSISKNEELLPDETIGNSITSFRDAFDKKTSESKEKSFESILAKDTRQRALKMQEDLIELSAESSNSDIEEISTETKEKNLRIKPMLRHDQLESETLNAQKKEADRLRRLEKRNNFLTKMLKTQSENINDKDLVLDFASSTKKFIKVHSDIVKHLKPHQRDGVKFMYDSCYGCVDALKENSGSGCILAHCMGLGKTLQVIALLHTVTSYKELKTSKILVLCPKSTIMNWADEIKRWLGPLEVKNLQIFNFSDTADIYDKINVLRKWAAVSQKSGCLIMGYEAFRSLVFYNTSKTKARSNMRVEDIRDNIHKYLLKPGADLVVCDEGHIIKNRKSGISLAAAEIITPKRIILTGTPIQNNLKEYYAMVNFIKPLILGTEKEFANLYANPIKNGQHKDSSKRDIKVMKQRSFVLHKKLSKFVQRKEAELLQSFLPQKFEYVLFIPMTDVQNTLYEFVLDAISKREDSRGKSLIPDYTCLRKIWTHPKVLEDAWKNAMVAKNKKEFKRLTSNIAHSDDDQPDDIYDSQTGVISVQRDWWRDLVTESDLELILPSNKLKTMFEIIRMAEENGEKCLIFTAFVAVLNVVEYFFHKINDKQRDFFMYDARKPTGHWINGQDYYRLDGKTNKTLRHEMVKRFNDPKNKRTRVFLISAKAGGQGINLIGANRVIILDTSWNPANDQQNIFRIFRLGQKKNCYVYRLIAMGTMEEKVYSRSVTKQAMSFRVVDEQQIDRHYNMAELAELYTLTKPDYKERPVPVFPQDQILANLLLNSPDLVYKYHEHDSLLENKMEQELSEQEKADAWVAYERDLQMNSEPRDAMMEGFQGYPLFGQGNFMYPPMPDFDPKNFLSGNYDPSQMDMTSRNPMASAILPNYLTNANMNRNSYLDILNMYKNFSTSLLGDKTGRAPHYNPPYGMPLGGGMMNNPSILPTNDSHLSALANPYYPFANSSLNSNALLANSNLSNSNPINADRYEPSKNLMTADHNFSSSMRNSFPAQMPAPYTKDLTGRSTQSKNLLQSPSSGPSSSSPIMRSSTRQIPLQNIYSTNPTRETIPSSIISKKLGKVSTARPSQIHSPSGLDTSGKNKPTDSLLRPISPRQTIVIDDSPSKQSSGPALPVNMGIVYPKPIPLSPISEMVEGGGCVKKPGSSMQIIRTDSPIADSVRKKFDNISPNISLTAVRTLPQKTSQSEKSPSLSSYLETTSPTMATTTVTPSNMRKRRGSFGNSSSAVVNTNEQPNKVSKYN